VRAYTEICNSNPDRWSWSRDIAIIRLTGKFSEADVPRVMPVYTSGDLPDRVAMYSTLGAPWQVTGYGFPFEDRVTGTLQSFQPITFDGTSSCGILGLAKCPAGRIEFLLGDGSILKDVIGTGTQPGDSGGAFTFVEPTSGRVFQAGVISGEFGFPPFYQNRRIMSPTFDFYQGNGTWINGFQVDADKDGIPDVRDNCSPAKIKACAYDITRCYNPDQQDVDGDGIGDACDNCPPARCGDRPLDCRNPSQDDSDIDGIGDACDICPAVANRAENIAFKGESDPDGDGVGRSCDNCPTTVNRFRACLGDSDCAVKKADGTVVRSNIKCISEGVSYGRCEHNGATCLTVSDCGAISLCVKDRAYGKCAEQTDDADEDGFGAACDSCSELNNPDVQANGNVVAEKRESRPTVGDLCDPVPILRDPLVSCMV
jgi:hypothetical protein